MKLKKTPTPPKKKLFDKYAYYFQSVQETKEALIFSKRVYKQNFNKELKIIGEDFCGTFALSCEWVKQGNSNYSIGVDLCTEALHYGKENYLSKLTLNEQKRVSLYQKDVREQKLPKVELIAALNFSFFVMKERKALLSYFVNCYNRLGPKGLLLIDCFGGSGTLEPCEDKANLKSFTYYWDQKSFNPLTYEAQFYIHFKLKNESKRHRVFSYDWRMWTIPELRDLLYEAGFVQVDVFMEGTTAKGKGNGKFTKKDKDENCESWISYITARRG